MAMLGYQRVITPTAQVSNPAHGIEVKSPPFSPLASRTVKRCETKEFCGRLWHPRLLLSLDLDFFLFHSPSTWSPAAKQLHLTPQNTRHTSGSTSWPSHHVRLDPSDRLQQSPAPEPRKGPGLDWPTGLQPPPAPLRWKVLGSRKLSRDPSQWHRCYSHCNGKS